MGDARPYGYDHILHPMEITIFGTAADVWAASSPYASRSEGKPEMRSESFTVETI